MNKNLVVSFQSAVAHELISNQHQQDRPHDRHDQRFKALSRMSSFPTLPRLRWLLHYLKVSKRCRA